MKRLLLAALLMLAISSFVVMPTFAADECNHDMGAHEPTVAALIKHVEHAHDMGHIKSVLVTPAMSMLNTAADESLPLQARLGSLRAFINFVNAQAGKGIHADCAQHLVMHAEHVIMALNGQM